MCTARTSLIIYQTIKQYDRAIDDRRVVIIYEYNPRIYYLTSRRTIVHIILYAIVLKVSRTCSHFRFLSVRQWWWLLEKNNEQKTRNRGNLTLAMTHRHHFRLVHCRYSESLCYCSSVKIQCVTMMMKYQPTINAFMISTRKWLALRYTHLFYIQYTWCIVVNLK